MELKENKNEYVEPKKTRRRKNRIFNAVLYTIAACLVLFGIFIILRDQTDLFNRNTAEVPDFTFPPVEIDGSVVSIATAEATELPTSAPEPTPEPTKPPPGVTEAPTPTPTPKPTNTPKPTAMPSAGPDSQPVRVYFYDYDIAVKVVPVGVNAKGEMETVPKHDVAGWYKFGPAPDQPGNCIIAGHNRYSGQKGLFALLHKGLKVGDRVVVTMKNGENVFYVVERINRYKYDAVPSSVMELGGEKRLTLITCLGDYSHVLHMSETRVVAVCKPIN